MGFCAHPFEPICSAVASSSKGKARRLWPLRLPSYFHKKTHMNGFGGDGTLEGDLTYCQKMKTMDRTLNLKTCDTQAASDSVLTVWVQAAKWEAVWPTKRLRFCRKPLPTQARPGHKAGRKVQVGNKELWIRRHVETVKSAQEQ